MSAELTSELDDSECLPSLSSFAFGTYIGPDPACPSDSACPAEYADVPIRELFARLDAGPRHHAAPAAGKVPTDGCRSRTSPPPPRSSSSSGFESGGALDECAPNGSLAGLADAVTRDGRLADLDDDELIGVMRTWQRLESWCNASLLDTVAELARRRPADRTPPAPSGAFPEQPSEFTPDEVAAALTLSGQAASTCVSLAMDLASRLPATARAQHEGLIDQRKARLIAEATRILSDAHAGEVEARVLPRAAGQTLSQLRAAVARAVLAVDPEAAARRREEAQRDPRVRRWQEDAGTAALAGFSLPPADVLEADQRLTARALALRQAGLPGTLEELRARAYLDALLGQDSTPSSDPRHDPAPATAPPSAAADATAGHQRRLPARVNLTVPLLSQLALTSKPGHVAGFGAVDAELARQLTGLAAADPASRCCLTLTDTEGRAVGHGCLPGSGSLRDLVTRRLTVTVTPLAQGSCDHRHQEPGYQPSRKLQHLIWARNPTCTAPGCGRPAARCDLDHTVPYDQGGRTCECDLAPLCRHHHRCKQSQGWQLDQPEPGVMIWTTPAGRHYITRPDAYP
jgi:hypothetical protein